MNYPTYEVATSEDRLRYEFISSGPKGNIRKIIEYTYVSWLGMWNLGFGDVDTETGQIRDDTITDNGDGRKVMATVVRTLADFFVFHPGETAIFTGSDERRTRIYKRIIQQYYAEFSSDLVITGLSEDGDEQIVETDNDYIAFVVRQKVI